MHRTDGYEVAARRDRRRLVVVDLCCATLEETGILTPDASLQLLLSAIAKLRKARRDNMHMMSQSEEVCRTRSEHTRERVHEINAASNQP